MDTAKIINKVNLRSGVLGKHIIEWVLEDKTGKSDYEKEVCDKLYYRYISVAKGDGAKEINPDNYYFIKYYYSQKVGEFKAKLCLDRLKSIALDLDELKNIDLFSCEDSVKGIKVFHWANYHRGDEASPFHEEAKQIMKEYFESNVHLKLGCYYRLSREEKHLMCRRDLVKSPRFERVGDLMCA